MEERGEKSAPPSRRKETQTSGWDLTSQAHPGLYTETTLPPHHLPILLFLSHSLGPTRAGARPRLCPAPSRPSHQAFDDLSQRAVPGPQLSLVV